MSSLSDFLFEGQAPPNVTQYGSTATNLPQWLSDYANLLLTGGAGVAAEPYQPYPGPRIAPFTPDQEAAFQTTRDVISGTPGPLTLAQPYLATAGRTFPESAASYMNPYIENVTNRAATLAGRALNERVLPALESKFGSLGQDVRSTAYRDQGFRGARDIMESLNEQNLANLASGYTTAGQQFMSDAERAAQLGLGMGPLARYAQQQGLTGAAALENIGQTQQAQTQRSLDTAYQDFLAQRQYPQQQLSFMRSLLSGLPYSSSSTSSQEVMPEAVGPSGLSQLASTAANLMGLINLFKKPGSRRGGRIRFADGGPLRLAYAA